MNPYAEIKSGVVATSDLFGNYRLIQKRGGAGGERGALLRYFCEQLNPSRIKKGFAPLNENAIIGLLPFMNDKRSLFWLKSLCVDSQNRNGYSSFSKTFWYVQKQQKRIDELVI